MQNINYREVIDENVSLCRSEATLVISRFDEIIEYIAHTHNKTVIIYYHTTRELSK